ncbi:MAG: hypothetical protein E7588_09905 [Ruminococcaceae bacterium]|nr:hypothetical protein [Oscillospiraceae bacterium]
MDELSDKLSKILGDPKSMEQIMALAGALASKDTAEQPQASQPQTETPNLPSDPAPLVGMLKSLTNSPAGKAFLSGEKERIQLLTALKPYMGNAKKEKLNKVISTMESVGSISSLAKLL